MKNKILKIGANKIREVESTLRAVSAKETILYVFDSYVDSLYGDVVRPQIAAVGTVMEQMVEHNTISYAMEVAEKAIVSDVGCIVSMSGGKTLDIAKYASYIAKIPLLSIPTTLAHDGIVSPIAVLKRDDNKPMSLGCVMPSMVILDTELVSTCPSKLIKAGIGDTISNYMALIDWEFAVDRKKDEMNGYAYMMSKNALDALMKTQYKSICPDFIEILANSLILSGIAMDFAGSSRPVSGSEHLFSHALDYYSDNHSLHGLNVALGTVAVLNIIGEDDQKVVNYLKRFEVDINPEHMGISEEIFIYCMKHATEMRTNRYTHLHEADLNERKLSEIYQEVCAKF